MKCFKFLVLQVADWLVEDWNSRFFLIKAVIWFSPSQRTETSVSQRRRPNINLHRFCCRTCYYMHESLWSLALHVKLKTFWLCLYFCIITAWFSVKSWFGYLLYDFLHSSAAVGTFHIVGSCKKKKDFFKIIIKKEFKCLKNMNLFHLLPVIITETHKSSPVKLQLIRSN